MLNKLPCTTHSKCQMNFTELESLASSWGPHTGTPNRPTPREWGV